MSSTISMHRQYTPNYTTAYHETDTWQLHQHNREKYGKEWVWYDAPIAYSFNSDGYRMQQETCTAVLSDYLLFAGCSHTVGLGMPLEATYPQLVSTRLNCGVVNVGMCGVSPEFTFLSVLQFLSTVVYRPKAVIVNWPNTYRTSVVIHDKFHNLLPGIDPPFEWKDYYKCFILHDSNRNTKFNMYRNILRSLCKSIDIAYFEFTQIENNAPDIPKILHPLHNKNHDTDTVNCYWARDVHSTGSWIGHYGKLNHEWTCSEIVKWFEENTK